MKKAADQSASSAGLIQVYSEELGMNVLQPRSAGLRLPMSPTAKMREDAEAWGQMASKFTTLQSLAGRIITRVGLAQRAEAIARGAAAVFGNDPEFRYYMDLKSAILRRKYQDCFRFLSVVRIEKAGCLGHPAFPFSVG